MPYKSKPLGFREKRGQILRIGDTKNNIRFSSYLVLKVILGPFSSFVTNKL